MPRPDRSTGPDRDRRWLILAVIGIAQLVVTLAPGPDDGLPRLPERMPWK